MRKDRENEEGEKGRRVKVKRKEMVTTMGRQGVVAQRLSRPLIRRINCAHYGVALRVQWRRTSSCRSCCCVVRDTSDLRLLVAFLILHIKIYQQQHTLSIDLSMCNLFNFIMHQQLKHLCFLFRYLFLRINMQSVIKQFIHFFRIKLLCSKLLQLRTTTYEPVE